MKQGKILVAGIILAIAMASLVISTASADSYCFLQMSNGQSIPFASLTDKYTCTLHSGHGFCTVCVNSSRWYASWNKCQDVCPDSGGNGGASAPNLTLTANFPFSDNGVFTKQSFTLDIITNKIASITLIDNIAETQKNLCPNCNKYYRSMSFKQGANDITIRAVNGNEIKEKRMRFFIDNKKPLISKTLPASNKYASGVFTAVYDEDNVEEVKLHYRVSGISENFNTASVNSDADTAVLSGCENGRKKNCSAEVSLDEFDGQQIEYWFEIRDIVNNLVSSRSVKVNVDISKPVISSLIYAVNRNYISINMSINEKNFYRVEYIDNNDNSPRVKVLCTSLKNGRCIKRVNFRGDSPDFSLKVSDKAGNFETKKLPEGILG